MASPLFITHELRLVASNWFRGKVCLLLHVTAVEKVAISLHLDPNLHPLNRIIPALALNRGETKHIHLIIEMPSNGLVETEIEFETDKQNIINHIIFGSEEKMGEISLSIGDLYPEFHEMLVSAFDLGKSISELQVYLTVDWMKSHPEDVNAVANTIRTTMGVGISDFAQLIEYVENRMKTKKIPLPLAEM